jgi:hypothetical protein
LAEAEWKRHGSRSGAPLAPTAARMHRPWGANTRSHVQAHAWLDIGWKVDSANLKDETVVFKRET